MSELLFSFYSNEALYIYSNEALYLYSNEALYLYNNEALYWYIHRLAGGLKKEEEKYIC